jgi:hypothetical protein
MVTRSQYLMGRDKAAPLTPELEANLSKLLNALSVFELLSKRSLPQLTSGYRPASINAAVGGAKRSNHMLCLAADFADPDGALDKFCLENQQILKDAGLYLEHPDATPGWCHLQAIAPKSGNRVFRP